MNHDAKNPIGTNGQRHRRHGSRRRLWAAIVGGALGFALALALLALTHAPIEGDGTIVLLLAPIGGVAAGVVSGLWVQSRSAAPHPPEPPDGREHESGR
jgi:hypothetical protein